MQKSEADYKGAGLQTQARRSRVCDFGSNWLFALINQAQAAIEIVAFQMQKERRGNR
jgi:hypothetical protein